MTTLRSLTEREKVEMEIGRVIWKIAADPRTRADLYAVLRKFDPTIVWPDQHEMSDLGTNILRLRRKPK